VRRSSASLSLSLCLSLPLPLSFCLSLSASLSLTLSFSLCSHPHKHTQNGDTRRARKPPARASPQVPGALARSGGAPAALHARSPSRPGRGAPRRGAGRGYRRALSLSCATTRRENAEMRNAECNTATMSASPHFWNRATPGRIRRARDAALSARGARRRRRGRGRGRGGGPLPRLLHRVLREARGLGVSRDRAARGGPLALFGRSAGSRGARTLPRTAGVLRAEACGAARSAAVRCLSTAAGARRTPPHPPRTKWTRRVPHPVLSGHAASLTPY